MLVILIKDGIDEIIEQIRNESLLSQATIKIVITATIRITAVELMNYFVDLIVLITNQAAKLRDNTGHRSGNSVGRYKASIADEYTCISP